MYVVCWTLILGVNLIQRILCLYYSQTCTLKKYVLLTPWCVPKIDSGGHLKFQSLKAQKFKLKGSQLKIKQSQAAKLQAQNFKSQNLKISELRISNLKNFNIIDLKIFKIPNPISEGCPETIISTPWIF